MCHKATPTAVLINNCSGYYGGPAICASSGGQGAGTNTATSKILREQCLSFEHSYAPLRMHGRATTYEASPLECQAKCAANSWCKTFVYNSLLKSCDFQDDSANQTGAIVYEISGPKTCTPVIKMEITVRGRKNILRESKEVGGGTMLPAMLGVMQGTMIMTLGNFTPYTPEPEPERPILDADSVEFAISRESWDVAMDSSINESVPTTLNITLKLDPANAMYAKEILERPDVEHTLKDNGNTMIDQYIPEFARSGVSSDVIARLKNLTMGRPQNVRLEVLRSSDAKSLHSLEEGVDKVSNGIVQVDDASLPGVQGSTSKELSGKISWLASSLALLTISLGAVVCISVRWKQASSRSSYTHLDDSGLHAISEDATSDLRELSDSARIAQAPARSCSSSGFQASSDALLEP